MNNSKEDNDIAMASSEEARSPSPATSSTLSPTPGLQNTISLPSRPLKTASNLDTISQQEYIAAVANILRCIKIEQARRTLVYWRAKLTKFPPSRYPGIPQPAYRPENLLAGKVLNKRNYEWKRQAEIKKEFLRYQYKKDRQARREAAKAAGVEGVVFGVGGERDASGADDEDNFFWGDRL